ncbi:MAG: F0F1 ATP synthase subunit epsilon [Saprospiraceae bacterium]|jgi:F-type H+-transporting ATPase subunit epsilon|nr:F0F1 ATP synthase subunit epsilon [Saprospiraceae bacterium]
MKITILTPDKEIFNGAVVSVKVPGSMGEFQVLKNHAPIVSSLNKGTVTLVTDGGEHRFYNAETSAIETATQAGKTLTYQIGGGFIEVLNNEISLLARGLKK